MTVSNSVIANNSAVGVWLDAQNFAATLAVENSQVVGGAGRGIYSKFANGRTFVSNSLIANNGVGIELDNGAIVRISNNTVTANTTGVLVVSGTVETRQNNSIRGNGTEVTGALTPFSGL